MRENTMKNVGIIAFKHYAAQNSLTIHFDPDEHVLNPDYVNINEHDVLDDATIEVKTFGGVSYILIKGKRRIYHYFRKESLNECNEHNLFTVDETIDILEKFEGMKDAKMVDNRYFFFFKTGLKHIILPRRGYYCLKKREDFSMMIPLQNCTFFGRDIKFE